MWLPSAASVPSTTVQAPQSPSAQPSFVPVRPRTSRRYSSTVMVHGRAGSHTNRPFSRKRTSRAAGPAPVVMVLPAPIHGVAPGRDQEGHVIVLLGPGNTDLHRGVFDE